MKKYFSYSILQYRHSLFLNETINVGILFFFPEDKVIRFVNGNLARVRVLYPDFDTDTVSHIIKNIHNKISIGRTGIFNLFETTKKEQELSNHLLREDDSSLQFCEFKTSRYPFDSIEDIIYQYCNLLLPIYENRKDQLKHDEHYILKTYSNYIFKENNGLEIFITKNRFVESNGISLKFNYSWETGGVNWENGSVNLVKAVSFDLREKQEIQNKSILYFGYLFKLNPYAEIHNFRYDLLVAKPKDKNLYKEYDKAIETINSSPARKKIVTEDELKNYSEQTIEALLKKKERYYQEL